MASLLKGTVRALRFPWTVSCQWQSIRWATKKAAGSCKNGGKSAGRRLGLKKGDGWFTAHTSTLVLHRCTACVPAPMRWVEVSASTLLLALFRSARPPWSNHNPTAWDSLPSWQQRESPGCSWLAPLTQHGTLPSGPSPPLLCCRLGWARTTRCLPL